jgi:hypothetical protein
MVLEARVRSKGSEDGRGSEQQHEAININGVAMFGLDVTRKVVKKWIKKLGMGRERRGDMESKEITSSQSMQSMPPSRSKSPVIERQEAALIKATVSCESKPVLSPPRSPVSYRDPLAIRVPRKGERR